MRGSTACHLNTLILCIKCVCCITLHIDIYTVAIHTVIVIKTPISISVVFLLPVPPMVLVSPKDIHLSIDSSPRNLYLACVMLTTVTGTLRWERGGREIVPSSMVGIKVWNSSFEIGGRHFVRSIMEICDVGVSDSDEYSCVAEDEMGRDVATFDVCVVGEWREHDRLLILSVYSYPWCAV